MEYKGAVTVQVRRRGAMAAVHVSNPFAGEVRFHDGLPCTTKEDAAGHGFGTLSMRVLAERYGGELALRAEGGVYELSALFPAG